MSELDLLYAALAAAMLIRPNFSSAVYVGLVIGYDLVFKDIDGFSYFTLGASADFLTISTISLFRADDKVIPLITCSTISIMLNLIGLVAWGLYLSSDFYAYSFYTLYAYACWVILRKERHHEPMGSGKDNFILRFYRYAAGQSHHRTTNRDQ